MEIYMNELTTECTSILSASKSIDASAFSSYSPSTVSNNSNIQSRKNDIRWI